MKKRWRRRAGDRVVARVTNKPAETLYRTVGVRDAGPLKRSLLRKRRMCGRDTCGRRPSGLRIECAASPAGVVNEKDVSLCSACYRTLNGQGVVHLGKGRLERAQQVVSLQDGSKPAWPTGAFNGWTPSDDDNVRLFALAYFSDGCDFLPAISGLPFEKMWGVAWKACENRLSLTIPYW